MTAQKLIFGTAVSFQAEDRLGAGEYGIMPGGLSAGIMLNPGLSTMFSVDLDEAYEEIGYTPAHGAGHVLEKVRNVKLGEELPFTLTTHPQVNGNWPLLKYITGAGSGAGLGDEPDSTTWMKELDKRWSVFTGIMMEDLKVEIPGIGVAKESYTGFAGHRLKDPGAEEETSPVNTEAPADTSRALVWDDIVSIRMDDTATPTEVIENCVSDITFGFASEVKKQVHPESSLTTKIAGVRVVSRKMFVSLKLTLVDQAFQDVVSQSQKQYLEMVIGPVGHRTTFLFGGLYFPKYVAKADPRNLVGDTITSIVDQPTFVYTTE
jgi:hypothetical protein